MKTITELDSDYLAISELTTEIGMIVQNALNNGQDNLSKTDIEHVLKITSDVTSKIQQPLTKLTV